MNNQQFKPLYEQAAEKLANALLEKKSPFHRPLNEDNSANIRLPYNRATGGTYRAMNAFILLLQNRDDPRWMTKTQARMNDLVVKENAKPTLINFVKTSDLQPVLDEKGERVPDENRQPQMKVVELEKPQLAKAWVFNGSQIDDIPDWKTELADREGHQELSVEERIDRIVKASGAVVIEGGEDAYYKPVADFIQMPEKEKFSSPERYYAELLHQLTHWTGHESRLNRPMDAVYGSKAYGPEELRANIATMMLSSELNIGYNLGKHAAYTDGWARMLKNEPFELVRAVNDAQKITDHILGYEQKRELKQEAAHEQSHDDRLRKGDLISYNGIEYKVLAELKNKVFQMQEGDGRKFKLSSNDNLYNSLVDAKANPQQFNKGQDRENDPDIDEDLEELAGLAEEQNNTPKMKR